MKHKIISLAIAALLTATLFSSCEKVIEFSGEETDPCLVMISCPETGSPWKVRLTQSRFFLSNDTITTIKNATLAIEVNGITANCITTNHGNGIYDIGYIPQAGDSLTLHIEVPNKGTLKAGCRMPTNISVSGLSYTLDTADYDYSGYLGREIEAQFTLNDPANERNYYMIRLMSPTEKYNVRTGTYDTVMEPRIVEVDDNVLFDIDASDEVFGTSDIPGYGYSVMFTDERINGHSHIVRFSSQYVIEGSYIEISSVSREYYLFYTTLDAASNQQDEILSFFSEPVQLFSNVEGGAGVLGGISSQKFPIF